jgi:lipopolysaccharide heptosyltransferase I
VAIKVIKLKKPPQKILIIKPSSLGDIVHSLPFLNSLKDSFPKSEIHWIVAKGLECLLDGNPMVDRLLVINKDEWKKIAGLRSTIKELRLLFKTIKNEKYDVVIDLQGLLRSGILAKVTGAAVRIGFKEAREGSSLFYTHKIKLEKDMHAVRRYLEIAKFLGCDISDIRFPFPLSFSLHPSTISSRITGEYAVLVPGARWQTKRWQPEKFGELASKLPIRFLVVGGRADIDISEKVVETSKGNAVSLAGKTDLKELIEVMRGAKFVVSNDSGPMHIAAALDIPVFAIFGPTNPLRTGPYGNIHTVIKKEIACSLCYKRKCKALKCMDALSVDEVAAIISLAQR